MVLTETDKKKLVALELVSKLTMFQTGRLLRLFHPDALKNHHPLYCGKDSNHPPLYPLFDGEKVVLICASCDYSWNYGPVEKSE